MKEQNYSNHSRYVPGFHFFTGALCVAVLVLAIINMVHQCCCGECSATGGCCAWLYTGLMPLLIAITLLMLFWYSRAFAVKVQDRAIRAEENFRHFVMTGKPFDSRLTMGQIISLRFADAEEYLDLVQRTINENLKPADIKKAVKKWKADRHRA